VGSERTIRVDVRVMAASNRDLEAAAATGTFRRDLYYRLSVITLTLPCLRERQEDIPDLAASYVEHFAETFGKAVDGVDPAALRALMGYLWPGNVRELINVVERAVLLARGPNIGLEDLPESIGGLVERTRARGSAPDFDPERENWEGRSWRDVRRDALRRIERAYLHELLKATGGRIGATAERADLSPRSLYGKMRAHGLRKEDYRTT
jgi:DNA-binding NtrC family response regulator